jgi:hypothetical protein
LANDRMRGAQAHARLCAQRYFEITRRLCIEQIFDIGSAFLWLGVRTTTTS